MLCTVITCIYLFILLDYLVIRIPTYLFIWPCIMYSFSYFLMHEDHETCIYVYLRIIYVFALSSYVYIDIKLFNYSSI